MILWIRIWIKTAGSRWDRRTVRSWSKRGRSIRKKRTLFRGKMTAKVVDIYILSIYLFELDILKFLNVAFVVIFFSGFWLRCLLAFSPTVNGSKIISTDPAAKDSLTCLHGLRVFSLGWVVMVHTYLQVFSIAGNFTNAFSESNESRSNS